MAIIGNLSVDEKHFVALREAGVMQRLVHLLEQDPQSRIPEIAAKTLANLAANDANQTAIRLAGGSTARSVCRALSIPQPCWLKIDRRQTLAMHQVLQAVTLTQVPCMLAGGIPPLMRLLIIRPSDQVSQFCFMPSL